MSDEPDILSINRSSEKALLDNGELLRVTNWFDDDGEECDAGDAVSCVIGPDRKGYWRAVDLTDFKEREMN